jgi:Rrf2 family protein
MMQLAARYGSDDPVRIRDIADAQGIPQRFLVQILLQLKGAGLVASTRGAAGGYQLVRPPHDVSLGEVIAVLEGQDSESGGAGLGDSSGVRVLRSVWRQVTAAERDVLESVTLADLVERARGRGEPMYYI